MNLSTITENYLQQETVPLEGLEKVRIQLHHPAFDLGAMGHAYLPPQPDYSHTSLGWVAGRGGLFTQAIPLSGSEVSVGLQFDPPSVLWIDLRRSGVLASFPLEKNSPAGLREWLKVQARTIGLDPGKLMFDLSTEIEAHPMKPEENFKWEGLSFALLEFKRGYSNGALLLDGIVRGNPEAGPVRCWPHHFDLSALLEFKDGDGKTVKTIGVGLSPGDNFYHQPYYYVTPWPVPPNPSLPELPFGGVWRTEEWTGAVLLHEKIVEVSDPESQCKGIADFLKTAVAAGRRLL
jgi:hypothetical protein